MPLRCPQLGGRYRRLRMPHEIPRHEVRRSKCGEPSAACEAVSGSYRGAVARLPRLAHRIDGPVYREKLAFLWWPYTRRDHAYVAGFGLDIQKLTSRFRPATPRLNATKASSLAVT